MYKYKLKEQYIGRGEVSFIGHGVTKNGVIDSDRRIESPLLDYIPESQPAQTQQPAVQQPAQATQPQQTETKENQ